MRVELLSTTRYNEFMNMPDGILKRKKFFEEIMHVDFSSSNLLYKEEGVIYYSYLIYRIKMNDKGTYYNKPREKEGFTYDNGKLRVWFGKSFQDLTMKRTILIGLGYDWVEEGVEEYITTSIMQNIMKGKITNSREIIKRYLKSVKMKDVSPELFYKMVKGTKVAKPLLLAHYRIAKDYNMLLELWASNKINFTQDLEDMYNQAKILNRKIDYTWSEARIKTEHNKWTKEIMEEEIKVMQDIRVDYPEEILSVEMPGFKLLDTAADVFKEGKLQGHCVYTSYWNRVKDKNYLVYTIENGEETATLGVDVDRFFANNSVQFSLNQVRGKYNNAVSKEIEHKCTHLINILNNFKLQVI